MTAGEFENIIRRELAGIPGELVVGVSGAADSVALLIALKAIGRGVVAVNCNFHLRGEESDRDSAFVEALCRRLDIPLVAASMDVEGYIATHGGSVEMACRELRYALFRDILRERAAARIAIAHNADDNVETLMLNLLRTSGVEGLKGMVPDTGEIVRPMLSIFRSDILRYLADRGQDYVTDSTNLSDDYRRNFIRNRVLPLIEERWPEARHTIAATQRNLRGEAEIVRRAVAPDSATYLSLSTIERCGDPRTAIRRFVPEATASQVDEMTDVALRHASGRCWQLPGLAVHSERDGLHRVLPDDSRPALTTAEIPNTPENLAAIKRCRSLEICFLPHPADSYTLRTVRQGDRMAPLGMRGTRLLSDIMSDAKMPRRLRECQQLLVAPDGEIIWAVGLKRSRHHLITPADPTIHILSTLADPLADLDL